MINRTKIGINKKRSGDGRISLLRRSAATRIRMRD
jgi:hypothetical protein